MGEKGLDFKHKEVINITDAKRLGYVQDVTADLDTGSITSIIVPGSNKLLNLFSSNSEIVIPWERIKAIGEEKYNNLTINNPKKILENKELD